MASKTVGPRKRPARFQSSQPSPVPQCISLLSETPGDLVREISSRDHMYNGYPDLDTYFELGRVALGHIRTAMMTVQKAGVNRILDLPCGHGRIMRWIKAEFPASPLAASDIDHDGVDFCARTFGASPLYGEEEPDPAMLRGERFDLIWSGSLLTHLDLPGWRRFLDFFEEALVPGGLLVFTTHGRAMADRLQDPETGPIHVAKDEVRARVLSGFERGFGYSDYGLSEEDRLYLDLPSGGLGISLSKPSYVLSLIEQRRHLRLVMYVENCWGFQDVVACLRV